MVRKELLKHLIANAQQSFPARVNPRSLKIPVDSRKIITVPGVRRCGKSSLFMDTINRLLESGVPKERILFLNFDDERLKFNAENLDEILQAYQELFPPVPLSDCYLFLDEIQMADDWQPFVRRVYEQTCRNIFITGSNSRMLSSELSTSLRGRSLQYEIFPLSFREYCEFTGIEIDPYTSIGRAVLVNAFNEFQRHGAFPEVVLSAEPYKERILQEYFLIMLYKDLIEHYSIRNPQPVHYFLKRIMANLTKPSSINKIFNELKSQGVSVGKNSIYEFVAQAESIYLFFPLSRFDPSLVKESAGDKKFYCIDSGLYAALLNPLDGDEGKLLENTVFLHLRRSLSLSQRINYFKGRKECDFVLSGHSGVEQLIQVSYSLQDPQTRRRELEGLVEGSAVTGCRNLLILTNDEEEETTFDSLPVRVMPVWKWLLGT